MAIKFFAGIVATFEVPIWGVSGEMSSTCVHLDMLTVSGCAEGYSYI